MNKRQGYLIHQPMFTAIHDNNLYCTIRVPYCTIRVPYRTTRVPYYTIRVPYDSVTIPILPRWSRVQLCDLWQIRLKCAAFKICFLVWFLFKLVIEEWCCSNVSHAAEDGHMISHIPAKHKHSVWDTQYGERELICLCGASIAAICLLHTGFQVYVLSAAHCPSHTAIILFVYYRASMNSIRFFIPARDGLKILLTFWTRMLWSFSGWASARFSARF